MLHKLPDEIARDILFRLPPKSLIQCTSVCKPWMAAIKNSSFIRTHLAHTINYNNQFGTHLLLLHCVPRVFLDGEPAGEHYYLHYDNNDFDKYCNIQCPIVPKEKRCNDFLCVVGISNGLVFLADDRLALGYTFIICNPSIRKSVMLPKPHLTFNAVGPYSACTGFGFDATTNDYKVVRLLTDQDDNPTMFEVYSLATGSWSNPREVVPDCEIIFSSVPAFVNGAIHWEAWRRVRTDGCPKFILAFDVGSDLFREIMLPKSVIRDGQSDWELSVTGDRKSIALFMMHSRSIFFSDRMEAFEVWVMKEYCNEESWNKVITLSSEGPQRSVPSKALCFRKSGELVLVMGTGYYHDTHELVSLDLVSKKFKNLGIREYIYYHADAYEESLVLLDKTDAISY